MGTASSALFSVGHQDTELVGYRNSMQVWFEHLFHLIVLVIGLKVAINIKLGHIKILKYHFLLVVF